MIDSLAALGAQQLVTFAVAALAAFFAVDVWQRLAPRSASRARRVAGAALAGWLLLALVLTLLPGARAAAAAVPRLQPALTVLGVLGAAATMLLPAARRAFGDVPLPALLALFYWRAAFGMCLLAFYTGGVLPAVFALAAGFGDALVTCLMVVLLAAARRGGTVPRGPLLAWNTLGLLDLVDAMVLLALVVRPWAAERG